ncbi:MULTISPECIES: LysR family transcriptional regulator [unclassified Leisingera]|uniref:LysR family transcriptional regulator n=1 Tax=unclassified Leisingera TaxID=2614906 RepID=UPI0010123577|nr:MULTISPECIES: LysR family transcriptional regulator [unclassified Leisingera]MBQ4824282.1 LysR family transcriptional regulator [Leisingera sp. HS039]QAX32047.1 LysR family transcriptional regulator [Leisingera sp. NJS204]QBR38934.1 LysR family transcriptional regulator [Leisingera sp. NJS201]
MAYLDNIRTFVRVYELGNMSAAARDMRISAAVASSRISQLEDHLNVRLFQRTTRLLNPTEQGNLFYHGAVKILEAVDEAEADISNVTQTPRGTLYVAAPLGLGQHLIAPAVPKFNEAYPLISIRLRLSDRKLDLAAEGLDAAFFLGVPEDSNLRIRKIADCARVLCASPEYIRRRGQPASSDELKTEAHDCLNLRYPGAPEFQWPLRSEDGVKRVTVTGPFESDHGDVLTSWALDGHGIILKPVFEISEHLASGRLVPLLAEEPPVPIQMACLYVHRRHQDPKVRLFMDFMVDHIQASLPSE